MTGVSTLSQTYKTTSTVISSTSELCIQKRYTLTHFELDLVFARQKIISSYVVYICQFHMHTSSALVYTTQHDNNNVTMTCCIMAVLHLYFYNNLHMTTYHCFFNILCYG